MRASRDFCTASLHEYTYLRWEPDWRTEDYELKATRGILSSAASERSEMSPLERVVRRDAYARTATSVLASADRAPAARLLEEEAQTDTELNRLINKIREDLFEIQTSKAHNHTGRRASRVVRVPVVSPPQPPARGRAASMPAGPLPRPPAARPPRSPLRWG